MPPTNLLQHIDENRHLLRKSEHKVADYVAAHPANVIHISIADLAAHCGVSEPTVLRFCRAIGCHGFRISNYNWPRVLPVAPALASLR